MQNRTSTPAKDELPLIGPPEGPDHTPIKDDDGGVAWIFMRRDDFELVVNPFLSPLGASGRDLNRWKLALDLGDEFQPDQLGPIGLFRTHHPEIQALRVFPSFAPIRDTWSRLPIRVPFDVVQKYAHRSIRPARGENGDLLGFSARDSRKLSQRGKKDQQWFCEALNVGYPAIGAFRTLGYSRDAIRARVDLPLYPGLTREDVIQIMDRAKMYRAKMDIDSARSRCLSRVFDASSWRQANALAEQVPAAATQTRARPRL
ncbi:MULTISPECIES: hypothetical protein [unclassified Thioalkalivibrio]|uniref:hypothetical protein n=1 Tax=unclassified Thioalkalivibrio TaxID=2621013 RepID=UPI0003736231|nr:MULTISPECIES: hypothetical protein [unclassified Thioalkalivibrio]